MHELICLSGAMFCEPVGTKDVHNCTKKKEKIYLMLLSGWIFFFLQLLDICLHKLFTVQASGHLHCYYLTFTSPGSWIYHFLKRRLCPELSCVKTFDVSLCQASPAFKFKALLKTEDKKQPIFGCSGVTNSSVKLSVYSYRL